MSVIQSIRERYAKWAVIAIALALLGFILTDYFQAKNRMGRGNSSTLGTVNGKKIDYISFETKLKARDDQQQAAAQQQQQEYTEAKKHETAEQLWNQEVEEIIMASQFKEVGIDVGKKEFNDYLFGQNPPQELRQRFSDQQGNYDGAAAQNAINQLRRSPNQVERDQLDAYLAAMEYNRKQEKYNSILTNSVYYPKWYVEKQNTEAAGLAKVSFVSYPYSKISDSTIKISDKEIEEYVSKHKDQFKQTESRSIAYTIFDAAPSAADSAAVRRNVDQLKAEFAADTLPVKFLARNGSAMQYFDGYFGKTQIQVPAKDSIFKLSKGAVYGPYLDNHAYVLAKLIDTKPMPDSVKARHILIGTYNPQTNQQLLDDSTAKKRIDSIELAIKGGARFDSMAIKYSTDQSSAIKGGLLSNPNNPATNYYTINTMVKEFNDFSFEGKKGEKKVVKTAFGYHLIEILDQKNFQPHYKVAYFAKNIIASDETERVVLEDASKFVSESQDLKSFNANIAKSNGRHQRFEATNIGPNDISIQDIDQRLTGGQFGQVVPSRRLVREIYKADKGDVIKQERIGDAQMGYKYIVAVVTDILEEGTQPAHIARAGIPASPMTGVAGTPSVEKILRDKKKAEQIKQMIGKVSTLEAAAAALKDSIVTVDSVRIAGNAKIADAKVLGAVFNIANKGKVVSEPIAGNNAVYVVRVDDLTTTSVAIADIEMQKDQMRQRAKQMQSFYSSPIKLLKDQATIKDNRRNFY
ncbi:MAG TPA: SurA N-terminal domain-containing protein [Chitinophagaceae bacterium]|nr:SurA N-terminal domain-containing protein [Chitinophagaceae bacterium]